jgi:hypothetical protein
MRGPTRFIGGSPAINFVVVNSHRETAGFRHGDSHSPLVHSSLTCRHAAIAACDGRTQGSDALVEVQSPGFVSRRLQDGCRGCQGQSSHLADDNGPDRFVVRPGDCRWVWCH